MVVQYKIYPENEPARMRYAYHWFSAAIIEWQVGTWTWLRGKPQRVCVETHMLVPK